MNLNDFYFTGNVYSSPETRAFTSNSKTSFMVEQRSSYNGKEKQTIISVSHWHKGESSIGHLKIGDSVLVKGKFSSSPYKDRHITNLDAASVVVLNQATKEMAPVITDDFPF